MQVERSLPHAQLDQNGVLLAAFSLPIGVVPAFVNFALATVQLTCFRPALSYINT